MKPKPHHRPRENFMDGVSVSRRDVSDPSRRDELDRLLRALLDKDVAKTSHSGTR